LSSSRAVFADPLGARQPVGRVAAQGDEVGYLVGAHAVALAHVGGPDRLGLALAGRPQHRDVVGDALEHVAVAGEEQRVPAGRRLGLRQAAEQVVGLERLVAQDGPVERLEEVLRVVPLRHELLGHVDAVGVVGRVELDAVVGGLLAEAQDHGPGRVLLDGLEHEVGDAEQRVDRRALVIGDGLGQRVEGAVEQRGRVDGEQRTGHRHVILWGLHARTACGA
jgi:hypothetical protein